jgi:16S rRNA (cytosine1402-N4)-methyltransferase
MHESVLLHETIDGLALTDGDIVIDGTLGRAGHSLAALDRGKKIFLIGIDEDEQALEESDKRLSHYHGMYRLFRGNFREMKKFLNDAGEVSADKVILDLGLSSPQLDSSGRGFTFRKDEPLKMTFRRDTGIEKLTARDIVNDWAEGDIANVIYAYGDERYARRIARAIVLAREITPIETTGSLAKVIEHSVPASYRRGHIHPATRSFQALRIAVNDELGALRSGLAEAKEVLNTGGRIAVISFHSLEDRIAKETFKGWEKEGIGSQMTKKPIVPSDAEMERNPRSRSAKLRIFIKTV